MKKIVIFGTGGYYSNRKDVIKENSEIVAFLDNNSELWGSKIDGILIHAPEEIRELHFDTILLMSLRDYEMKSQLSKLGVSRDKIQFYEEFIAEIGKNKVSFFFQRPPKINYNKSVLIITFAVKYGGAKLMALYVAEVLIQRGYTVTIALSEEDEKGTREILNKGINIILYSNLSYAKYEEMFWTYNFKYIIVNTLWMINCVCEIGKRRPVIWWLHEPLSVYRNVMERYDYIEKPDFEGVNIYAVSDIAIKNFNSFFPEISVGLLPYGIPDKKEDMIGNKSKKVIFAIIGVVFEVKAQDVFLRAANQLKEEQKECSEFWVIGNINGTNGYCKNIRELANNKKHIKILGELTRGEMDDIYKKIDVVVNPSREDMLPTVIAEGMMHGKVCITSDVTGMTRYIHDRVNGLICKSEDAGDLCSKFEWILSHREKMTEIGKRARKTYEQNFTMELLGERIDKVLKYET